MVKITDLTKCSGCSACASVCPKSCISMVRDKEGFTYPKVNEEICINCGLCEKVCPIITPKETTGPIKAAYAALTKSESIRENSSSGGLFYELAMTIIKDGGIVFGACFDKDMRIVHGSAQSEEELFRLLGSKYAQSDTSDIFPGVKEALNSGRAVLFSGTPCQVAGLHSFLKKPYDNLYCIDLICHGVPSPKIWESYISSKENKACSKLKSVCFRCKDSGWRGYSVKLVFENGYVYKKKAYDDCYFKAFLGDLATRPSCYDCHFKGENRYSDITLGDFWGIEHVAPDMDGNKGTTLVMIRTEKGNTLLEKVRERITLKEVDFNASISKNTAYSKSCLKPKGRDNFIEELNQSGSFESAVKRYTKPTLKTKIKRLIKKFLKLLRGR